MSEPITKEQLEAAKEHAERYGWARPHELRGYEALVVDLEQKIEDKSLKILALTEEMMEAAEASSVKVLDLERRLKIAEDALSQTGAMAMAKVNK